MELGGNAPFIVFDDADLEKAVEGALIAKFRNSGQTCVCANRFYIQDGIYERLVARFAERVDELVVGRGDAPGTQVGPMIDGRAASGVERLVGEAVEAGARVVTGGRRHAMGEAFFEPTLLADVAPDMRVAREEISGRWRRSSDSAVRRK